MKKLILLSTILFSFCVGKAQSIEDTIPLPAIQLFAEANGNSSTNEIYLDFTLENETGKVLYIFAKNETTSKIYVIDVEPGEFIDSTFIFIGVFGNNEITISFGRDNYNLISTQYFFIEFEKQIYTYYNFPVATHIGNGLVAFVKTQKEQESMNVYDQSGNIIKKIIYFEYISEKGYGVYLYQPKDGIYIFKNTITGASRKVIYIGH